MRKLLIIILILGVGLIIYLPALSASFQLDDGPSIRDNAAIRHLSPGEIWKFWPSRFFTYLTLALNFRISGLDTLPYHLTNIFIHLLNSVLVFLLLRKLLKSSDLVAGLGALLFLCHPLQTQAVTYVIQRATSLAVAFYLLSILFYLKSIQIKKNNEDTSITKRHSGRWFSYILSLLFCVCAMLTKEFTISLPLVLVVMELLLKQSSRRRRIARLLPFLIALLIIPLLVGLYRGNSYYNDSGQLKWLQEAGMINRLSPSPGQVQSPRTYLLTQSRVFLTYLRLLAFPIRQRLEYDYPVFFFFFQNQVITSLLFLVTILISSFFLLKKKKTLEAFGLFFVFITLLPESSIIPIRDVAVEHRLYLPIFGIVLAYASLGSRRRPAWLILTILVIAIFSTLTYRRNLIWRDPITLWEDNVVKAVGKARLHGNLGKAYLDIAQGYRRKGKLEDASPYFEKARREFKEVIRLDPTYTSAYNNLAVICIDQKKDYKGAIRYLEASLKMFPDYPAGYLNLGVIQLNSHRIKPAIKNFQKALELDPKNLLAHYNLAACYLNLKKPEQAEKYLRRGLDYWPEEPKFYNLLALIYHRRGEKKKAEEYTLKARRTGRSRE